MLLLAGDSFKETNPQKLGDFLEWSVSGATSKLAVQFRGRGLQALVVFLDERRPFFLILSA